MKLFVLAFLSFVSVISAGFFRDASVAVISDLLSPHPATCEKPGDCGRAYQTCCAAFGAKGYPCGCHLVDGNGTVGANCGDCGTAYGACCIGFKAKGFPCTCDIN